MRYALAIFVYGGWEFYYNWPWGLWIALRAGTAQGLSSAISTICISIPLEFFYARAGKGAGLIVAWLLPATGTALMHACFQWLIGTPSVLFTIHSFNGPRVWLRRPLYPGATTSGPRAREVSDAWADSEIAA